MKRIGILGGMGPQATVDLYQKIIQHTPAVCDQEHIPVLIDSYPQIEDRTAALLHGGASPVAKLVESARRLQQGGAQALIIPCNTAHAFADAVAAAVEIPILHIAAAAMEDVKAALPAGAAVLILATQGTIAAGIYQQALQAAGYRPLLPTAEDGEMVMRCIYDGAKAGKIADYAPQLAEVLRHYPAQGALLACTELPLFAPFLSQAALPLFDPTDALARRAVAFAKS